MAIKTREPAAPTEALQKKAEAILLKAGKDLRIPVRLGKDSCGY